MDACCENPFCICGGGATDEREERLARIDAKMRHPVMANAFWKMINTPDMIIWRAEVAHSE